eukprot:424530-Pelagomonas_calceolata.AAC.2
MKLAPLPATKATLMLSLCALSQANVPTLVRFGEITWGLGLQPGGSTAQPADHLDPANIPPRDREFHLAEFKFCPDTDHFPTLEAATTQHASTISRLKTSISRVPNRVNTVILHRCHATAVPVTDVWDAPTRRFKAQIPDRTGGSLWIPLVGVNVRLFP